MCSYIVLMKSGASVAAGLEVGRDRAAISCSIEAKGVVWLRRNAQ